MWPRRQPGRSGLQQPTPLVEGEDAPFLRWAKPGAQRPTQAGAAGWPDFDPDFAEEPGLVEPYLSAIRDGPLVGAAQPAFKQGDYQMNVVEFRAGSLAAGGHDVRLVIESCGFELIVNREPIGHNHCALFHT